MGNRTRPKLQERIRELLNGSGLRSTPARAAVLERLSAQGRPLAHGEIVTGRGAPALDRVTVYRTLHTLQDAGLVHRVQDRRGSWRYCARVRLARGCPGDHVHFQCTRCGRMDCLERQPLPWVEGPAGAVVAGKQFLVYGLCPACARTERALGR
jgi:Fur family transcriptional regulator, ferric uptake regulator